MHDLTQLMHKTSLAPFSVVSAGRVEFGQGHQVRPHHHTTWELVYILEGDIRCVIDNTMIEAQPGTLLITPPRTVHFEMCAMAWSCYYIWIDAPAEYPWPRVYHDDRNRSFGSLCAMLIREWGRQEPERAEMLSLVLNQFDILLRRSYGQRQLSSAERLVQQVEQRLEECFAKPVTIKELAHGVGVSPSYLRAQFVRLRGHTPMAYLQSLRVQHALALISNSNLTLEAIAHICGYDSASHLSRHVKRATGKSPGAFRWVHPEA